MTTQNTKHYWKYACPATKSNVTNTSVVYSSHAPPHMANRIHTILVLIALRTWQHMGYRHQIYIISDMNSEEISTTKFSLILRGRPDRESVEIRFDAD